MASRVSIEDIAKQLVEDTALSVEKEDITWKILRSNMLVMGEQETDPVMTANESAPSREGILAAVQAVREAAVGIHNMNAALMPVVEAGMVNALIDACEGAVVTQPNLSAVAAHLQRVAEA